MRLRFLLSLAASLVAASVVVGTAAADRPTREEFSPVGEQITCGETLLTISAGVVVDSAHVHELRNGLFRVIIHSVPRGIQATDEEGTTFRIVGSAHGNFTTPNPNTEGGEVGFFRIKLNIIGPDGLLGTLDFLERVKRSGQEIVRDRGTCQFLE